MAQVEFVPSGDGSGRLIPRLTITPGQKTEAKELSYDEVASAGAAPQELSYDEVANATPEPSVARSAGLTVRSLLQGAAGIPMLAGDAANSAINLPVMGLNKLTGSNIPMIGLPSQGLQTLLSGIGLPKPETTPERIADVGVSTMGGVGAASGLSRLISSVATSPQGPALLQRALDLLADAPVMQTLGGLGGAAAVEGVKAEGQNNPLALGGAMIAGSLIPGTAGTAGQRLGAGAAQVVKPFLARGREQLVGEALNRVATNPTAAATRLANSAPLIPGSNPTVSQVSRDAGLIRAESSLPDENGLLATRRSAQNTAQMAELDRIARDDAALTGAQAKRNRTFDQYAEPAFENAAPVAFGNDVATNPVFARIRAIRQSPAGGRQTVREALDEVESLLTAEGVNYTDARTLYEVRKDLDLLRTGKLSGAGKSGRERANMSTARHQIDEVVRDVDGLIEAAAPGYGEYMQMFAKRSIPVSQLQALQDLRARAVTAAPDPVSNEPRDILSQAKFKNLLRANVAANPRYGGTGPGAATMRGSYLDEHGKRAPVLARLSPQQIRVLDRVAADLDRGSATSAATVKAAGSDTFKNMSIAAVIGRVLGDKTGELMQETSAGKTFARPFSYLYRMPDRDIQTLLLEAWLDPQLASRLMRQATRAEIEGIAKELKTRAARQSVAASLYGTE